jgi:hypothetical protein
MKKLQKQVLQFINSFKLDSLPVFILIKTVQA